MRFYITCIADGEMTKRKIIDCKYIDHAYKEIVNVGFSEETAQSIVSEISNLKELNEETETDKLKAEIAELREVVSNLDNRVSKFQDPREVIGDYDLDKLGW